MNHDEMGVRSDFLTFLFIYAKRRPSFLLKLILVSLKKHFGDIERKTSVLVIFVFLLRISIYTVTTHKSLKYYGVTYVFVFCQNMGWHFIIKFMVCFLGTEYTDWDFHRETFILRLCLTAHIHDI